ncbi:MAG: hypothetical protein DSY50_03150 [Desulfobulbus sp.]|nr:MAG: hypothetical protein DSY50_03150 [Desulfobulbus sp.]
MKKTLLITGGTGILGKHLVTRFLANGHRVTILCRNPKPDLFPTSNQPRWLQGDVSLARLGLEQKSYQSLVKTTDTVFHLAARTDFKGKNLEAYTPVNINGVRTIYSFAAKANAPLHHVSTAFVCGRQQGTLSEQMLDRGQKFRNFYEESKFRGECFLRKQQAATALPITIYRPSIILERQPDRNSGGNFEKSHQHFDRAREITDGGLLIPDLLQAQYLARQEQDQEDFHQRLTAIIDAPDDLMPSLALQNQIAKRKAAALLKKESQWFE